jgi:hypothetical protein
MRPLKLDDLLAFDLGHFAEKVAHLVAVELHNSVDVPQKIPVATRERANDPTPSPRASTWASC